MNLGKISASLRRWPHLAVWVGVLTALAGSVSYFSWAVQFAALRDFPLFNLPMVLLGAALAGAGCLRVFKREGGIVGKGLAGVGLLAAVGIAGLFAFYIFGVSADLPEAAGAPAVGEAAPDFTLPDENGQPVRLSDYLGSKVVLLFYRGFW